MQLFLAPFTAALTTAGVLWAAKHNDTNALVDGLLLLFPQHLVTAGPRTAPAVAQQSRD